jgi:O-antigen ligase
MALGLTDSMSGWVAMLAVIGLMLVCLRRFDYLAVMVLLVLPLGAVGLVKFGEPIFYRIEQLFSGQAGWGTVSSRMTIYQISLRLIGDHPWMGIGRGNFQLYGETYYSHAHNLFLMKMIEMGIPAGLAFAGLLIGIVGRVWWSILTQVRRLSEQGQYYNLLGLGLGCLGFVAMNLLDYNYIHFSLGPMFMTMLGIALAVAMEREEPGSECKL